MADNGWQRKFEDPIPLPKDWRLLRLKDTADYIMELPKKESDLPEWQTAIEVLMLVSRSGPTMMARIESHEGAEPHSRIENGKGTIRRPLGTARLTLEIQSAVLRRRRASQ